MPPAERRRPQAHWQVSYMEPALDFEAYAGRQLPPAPQSRFVGGEMPLQEKAKVLRLITSLMGRAVGQDTILPAKMTNHCETLMPMGAGLVMGLEGRPLFTRPLEVSRHLQRLRTYGEERWAQRQRFKQAQKKARRDRAQGAKPQRHQATPADRRRCPAKGGQALCAALRHGLLCETHSTGWQEAPPLSSGGHGAREWEPGATYHTLHTTTRAHTATQAGDTQAAAKDVGVRGTRTPTVQSVRAGTQGSTVLLCPRAPGAPAGACDVPPCRGASPHPTAPHGGAQSQPEDSRSGGGGTTPSPQEARNAHAGEGGGAHTRGSQPHPRRTGTKRRRGETPPQNGPPGKRARRPERHGRAGTEVS